jgi:hypothetical protein
MMSALLEMPRQHLAHLTAAAGNYDAQRACGHGYASP